MRQQQLAPAALPGLWDVALPLGPLAASAGTCLAASKPTPASTTLPCTTHTCVSPAPSLLLPLPAVTGMEAEIGKLLAAARAAEQQYAPKPAAGATAGAAGEEAQQQQGATAAVEQLQQAADQQQQQEGDVAMQEA